MTFIRRKRKKRRGVRPFDSAQGDKGCRKKSLILNTITCLPDLAEGPQFLFPKHFKNRKPKPKAPASLE